jgi:histidine decarboxylase
VDAALSGAFLPYLEYAPPFDFRLPIDSLTVSGHKFYGVPIPCAAFVCRKAARRAARVEYLGSDDATLCGSRDGLASLLFLHALRHGEGSATIGRCLKVTSWTLQKLKALGWPAWSPPWSTTVVIRRPSVELVTKWQLATEGNVSHIICMPHVTHLLIDEFCKELVTCESSVSV